MQSVAHPLQPNRRHQQVSQKAELVMIAQQSKPNMTARPNKGEIMCVSTVRPLRRLLFVFTHLGDGMKAVRVLKGSLVGLVLGVLSATAWAQCAPGGQFIEQQMQGYTTGFCTYPSGNYYNHGVNETPVPTGNGSSGDSSSSTYSRPQPPKIINRYGAVALNKSGGSFGSTRMASSEQEAIKGALADCGGTGCSIFSSYKNQCVAMAWGKKNKGGMNFQAFSLQSADAENSALKKCTTSKAQNCQIVLSECSKYN